MSAEREVAVVHEMDKVSEEKMADLLGTTVYALRARRARRQIPMGVWIKQGSRIIYSIRRYEEWLESQWVCPEGWKSSGTLSVSALPTTGSGAVKRSPIPRHKKASQLHPSFAIR